MGDVVNIGCVTRLDLPVDIVLDAAKDTLESVIVIGYAKDGSEYFASTLADGGDVLWLLERCKAALFASADGDA